jgi:hypothetical protein
MSRVTDLYPPTPLESLGAALLDGGADLLPVIGPILKRLCVDSANRQAAATGELIEKVAVDVGVELFTSAIQENPRLRSLMLNAIDLCHRTSFEEKKWLYAEALRDGIKDPAKINKAIVDFQVLRDVEVPHIQVLDELASIDLRVQALSPLGEPIANRRQYMDGLEEYQNAWDQFPAPITAVLVNAGLAKELPLMFSGPGPEVRYTLVTRYGHKLLHDFHRLGMN